MTHKVGDLVGLHRSRFPKWEGKSPLTDTFPHGPYRIIKVGPGSVTVMCHPKLGGKKTVAFKWVKAWPEDVGEDEVWEEMADELAEEADEGKVVLPEGIPSDVPKFSFREVDKVESMEEKETEEPELTTGKVKGHEVELGGAEGHYKVKDILGHRYNKGWRFLTYWDGYNVDDSSWQPLGDFVNKGYINTKFYKYCVKHKSKLGKALLQAKSLRDVQLKKLEEEIDESDDDQHSLHEDNGSQDSNDDDLDQ